MAKVQMTLNCVFKHWSHFRIIFTSNLTGYHVVQSFYSSMLSKKKHPYIFDERMKEDALLPVFTSHLFLIHHETH